MEEHKYKLGYYSIIIDTFEPELFRRLKECSELCEYFVIGIPDDYVMARITGTDGAYSCEMIKELLLDFSWINDVIILNWEMLNRQNIYEQVPYDVYFYDSEYEKLDKFYLSRLDEEHYLKRSHEILRYLMKEFDRVCTKYGLRYYVIYGSLIGVVRHHEMIPWDDDIDIGMPRADFNKLCLIAQEEWNTDEFMFLRYDELGNGVFHDFMTRLLYNKERLPTKVFDKVGDKAAVDIKDKLFIDIYVMDEASKNQKKHMFVMMLMKGVYALCMGHRGIMDYNEYKELPRSAFMLLRMAHLAGKCVPLKLLMAMWNRLCLYASKEECDDYFMSSNSIVCIERKVKQKFFGEGQRMQFYDMEVLIPSDYIAFLGTAYTDYTQFPPMSLQKPSHYFMSTDMKIWSWVSLKNLFSK